MKNSTSGSARWRSHLRGLCVAGLLTSLVFNLSGSLADEPTDDFNLAVGLYRKQRWDLASESFRRFLDDYPDHARANLSRLYLGLSLNSMEQYAPAREQFMEYVRADPDSANLADARYRIAECSYHLNEFALAIRQFDGYLTAHSDHELAHWAQLFSGDAHNSLKQWEQAETILRPLLDLSPQSQLVSDATFSLARSLEGQNKQNEALALYRELSNQTNLPIAPRADLRIGAILFRQKSYKEAAAVYDRIQQTTANTALKVSATLNAGLAMYRLGEFEQAIVRLAAVPDDSPLKPRTTMLIGLSYRELENWEEARKALDQASVMAVDTSLAPEILFERAQLERLADERATSARMFEDFADRWPSDRRIGDCLFNAAELQIELSETEKARGLFNRLSGLSAERAESTRTRVLEGRILLKEDKPDEAIAVFKAAVGQQAATESSDRSAVIGRYYLVRTYHQQGQHQNAIDALGPLLPVLASGTFSELKGAIAVGAISSLQLKKYTDAKQYADRFLAIDGKATQEADVLAARCVASAELGEFESAMDDAMALTDQFAGNPQTWNAILQAAEAAWNAMKFTDSGSLFALAASHEQDEAVRSAGLSGQAWSLYNQDEFTAAGQFFRKLADELPQSTATPEARHMHAMSLLKTDNTEGAIAAFRSSFQAAADASAANNGNSALRNARLKYGMDSGRMAAHWLGEAGKIDEADQLWEALATTFSESDSLDQILDEWAFLNLANQRYDRSDEIYQRLLDEFPTSRFAGQARLSLAESDMQAKRIDKAIAEFTAIVEEPNYQDTEKEKALYQLIDIYAGRQDWAKVRKLAGVYAATFSAHDRAAVVQLLYAESLLNEMELQLAEKQLLTLRKAVADELLEPEEWTERIWVLLAETALTEGRYQDIDGIVDDLQARVPTSPHLYQLYDVQGRRWKTQAEPDFVKARQYFQKVVQDEHGRGTATAARCQFMIAETFLLQKNLSEARREYYRVYLTYSHDDWQARGLFQAAGCEVQMARRAEAIRGYEDLLGEFPDSELVDRAREKLAELTKAERSSADGQ